MSSSFTPAELHEQLETAHKLANRAARAGDAPVVAHYLFMALGIWDDLEASSFRTNDGTPLVINVPLQEMFPHLNDEPGHAVHWGSGWNEPRGHIESGVIVPHFSSTFRRWVLSTPPKERHL